MDDMQAGVAAPGYPTCRYGASRAAFRGPARDLSQPYVAFLGGSATVGKTLAQPFPELVERATGLAAVNLAAPGAGPDFYLADHGALEVASRAELAVVQVPGADSLSNPFYTVHRRRNDRFLAATPALRALFPDLDLSDIHFTRHLLTVLSRVDPRRFALVRKTLRTTWLSRMEILLDHLPRHRVLLWLADSPPGHAAEDVTRAHVPLFVDDGMLQALRPAVSTYVFVVDGRKARPDNSTRPSPWDDCVGSLPGPDIHNTAAGQLARSIQSLLSGRAGPLDRRQQQTAGGRGQVA